MVVSSNPSQDQTQWCLRFEKKIYIFPNCLLKCTSILNSDGMQPQNRKVFNCIQLNHRAINKLNATAESAQEWDIFTSLLKHKQPSWASISIIVSGHDSLLPWAAMLTWSLTRNRGMRMWYWCEHVGISSAGFLDFRPVSFFSLVEQTFSRRVFSCIFPTLKWILSQIGLLGVISKMNQKVSSKEMHTITTKATVITADDKVHRIKFLKLLQWHLMISLQTKASVVTPDDQFAN